MFTSKTKTAVRLQLLTWEMVKLKDDAPINCLPHFKHMGQGCVCVCGEGGWGVEEERNFFFSVIVYSLALASPIRVQT